jgi:hypothetical protein
VSRAEAKKNRFSSPAVRVGGRAIHRDRFGNASCLFGAIYSFALIFFPPNRLASHTLWNFRTRALIHRLSIASSRINAFLKLSIRNGIVVPSLSLSLTPATFLPSGFIFSESRWYNKKGPASSPAFHIKYKFSQRVFLFCQ